ncbi:MAG: class I SAM-dependent methyltransferase [Clostridiales bacterium]|nr:class I SAM-dependent methyltransferase [Clostridiales bacterium]
MVYCAICHASTVPILYTTKKAETTYHRCLRCGFTLKDRADILSAKDEFQEYENHNNSIHDRGYVSFLKDFLRQAALPFARGKACLDFGSGPEPVLAQLLQRDYGFCVDIYDKFYAPAPVYEGKTYDLLTCTEVLEHIPDPRSVFALFRRAMHSQSVLSLMTSLRPISDSEFLEWSYIREATHIAFYTMEAMTLLAQEHDLRIIYTDHKHHISLMTKESVTRI